MGILASLGHVVAPLLTPQPFHPVDGFQGLAKVSHAVSVLAVPAASPHASVAAFVAAARAEPGRLNYLRPGHGSFAHMAVEMIQRSQGIRLTAVDYRGLPPGVIDLIAGRLDVAVLTRPSVQERLRAVGTVPSAPLGPAATQALLAREFSTYATLVREANIRAEG